MSETPDANKCITDEWTRMDDADTRNDADLENEAESDAKADAKKKNRNEDGEDENYVVVDDAVAVSTKKENEDCADENYVVVEKEGAVSTKKGQTDGEAEKNADLEKEAEAEANEKKGNGDGEDENDVVVDDADAVPTKNGQTDGETEKNADLEKEAEAEANEKKGMDDAETRNYADLESKAESDANEKKGKEDAETQNDADLENEAVSDSDKKNGKEVVETQNGANLKNEMTPDANEKKVYVKTKKDVTTKEKEADAVPTKEGNEDVESVKDVAVVGAVATETETEAITTENTTVSGQGEAESATTGGSKGKEDVQTENDVTLANIDAQTDKGNEDNIVENTTVSGQGEAKSISCNERNKPLEISEYEQGIGSNDRKEDKGVCITDVQTTSVITDCLEEDMRPEEAVHDPLRQPQEGNEHNDDILKEKKTANNDYENLLRTLETFSKENDGLLAKNESVQNEMEEIGKYLKAVEKVRDEKIQACTEMAEKDIKNQQTIEDLRSELTYIRQSLKEQFQKDAWSQERTKLQKTHEAEKQKLQKEMEKANKKANDNLKQKLKDKDEELKKKVQQMENLTREKKEVDKQNAHHESYIQKLHEHIKKTGLQKEKDESEHNKRVRDLSTKIQEERTHFNRLSYQYNELDQQIQTLQQEKRSLTGEKQDLLLRLSKVAGANLTYNNPNIADLSDEKRPTKLAEEFSELYDNEWTDAFEDLQMENEEQKTTYMLKLVKKASRLCNDLSSAHGQKIKDSLCTLKLPIPSKSSKRKQICIGDYDVKPKAVGLTETNDTPPKVNDSENEEEKERTKNKENETADDTRSPALADIVGEREGETPGELKEEQMPFTSENENGDVFDSENANADIVEEKEGERPEKQKEEHVSSNSENTNGDASDPEKPKQEDIVGDNDVKLPEQEGQMSFNSTNPNGGATCPVKAEAESVGEKEGDKPGEQKEEHKPVTSENKNGDAFDPENAKADIVEENKGQIPEEQKEKHMSLTSKNTNGDAPDPEKPKLNIIEEKAGERPDEQTDEHMSLTSESTNVDVSDPKETKEQQGKVTIKQGATNTNVDNDDSSGSMKQCGMVTQVVNDDMSELKETEAGDVDVVKDIREQEVGEKSVSKDDKGNSISDEPNGKTDKESEVVVQLADKTLPDDTESAKVVQEPLSDKAVVADETVDTVVAKTDKESEDVEQVVNKTQPDDTESAKKTRLRSDFEDLSKEQKKTIMDVKKFVENQLSKEVETAVTDLIVQEHGVDAQKQDTVLIYIKNHNFGRMKRTGRVKTFTDMSSKTETDVLVPVDDLEKELDSVVLKLKNELRKTHSRNADLMKSLQLQIEQNSGLCRCIEENEQRMLLLHEELCVLKKKTDELQYTLSNEQEKAVDNENSLKLRLETKETELQGKVETVEKNEIDIEALNKHISDSKIYIEKMQSRISDMADQKTKDDLLHKETVEGLQKQIQEMAAQRTNETLEHKSAVKELQDHLDKERKSFYDLSYQYSQLIQAKASSDDLKSIPGYQEHKAKGLLLARHDKGQQTDIRHSQAHLSEENRPTKLAEEFSELYDIEWTDALEELLEEDDMQRCKFMLTLLKRANEICRNASIEHRNAIKRSFCTLTVETEFPTALEDIEKTGVVYDEVPGRVASGSKSTGQTQGKCEHGNGREDVAKQKRTIVTDFEQTLGIEQKKAVMNLGRVFEIQQSEEVEKIGTKIVSEEQNITQHQKCLLAYIRKCMNICWSMYRHVPPLHVDFSTVTGDIPFDSNKFKRYTKVGKYVDYIVWPAVYLHDGGPILCKGVAQGRK